MARALADVWVWKRKTNWIIKEIDIEGHKATIFSWASQQTKRATTGYKTEVKKGPVVPRTENPKQRKELKRGVGQQWRGCIYIYGEPAQTPRPPRGLGGEQFSVVE